MKRTLFLCAVLSLLASLVFGAGGQQQSGPSRAGDTRPEVSVNLLDRGQVPASEGTYDNNRWTQWINENSPVRVRFVPVPRSGSRAALVTLFASNTAPDLVWEYNKSHLDYFYEQGVIQPVGDHINNFSTAYKAYLQANPDLMGSLFSEGDGLQYGMTSRRTVEQVVNLGIFARQDWLDRFNMRVPTTLDECLAFMRRAKAEDPSGLGTWGVGTNYAWNTLTTALFGRPADNFLIQNGRFVDWYSTPAYRDSLAYMRTMYQEGLIDPEYITDGPNFTRQNQFISTGRVAMTWMGMGIEPQFRDMVRNVPTARMVAIDSPSSPYGRFGFGQEAPFLKMVLMNRSVRDARPAMQYMDWLITDGYWTLAFGIEGRHYRLVNGVPQVIDPEVNRVEVDYIKGNIEFALVDRVADRMTPAWIPVMAAQDPVSQAWATLRAQGMEKSFAWPTFAFTPFTPTSTSIQNWNIATSGQNSQVYALEMAIITGRLTVDEGLNQINAFKRANGWDAINAEKDAWFQRNRNRPGFYTTAPGY